jgi:hypothetical protein
MSMGCEYGRKTLRPAPCRAAAALSIMFSLLLITACKTVTMSERDNELIEPARFTMTLHPTLNDAGEVDAIEVSSVLEGGLASDTEALKLTAPIVYVNVHNIADRITDLDVTDARGAVDFTTSDDAPVPGGYPYFRHWTAERPVEFPVTIHYRALVQPEGGPRGPAFGIRPSAGGVSGAGAGFMLVPENAASQASVLDWDLSGFNGVAIGVTTFGEGTVEVGGPPANLMQGWYMAGPAEQYPDAGTNSKFHAYWLGEFPFDEHAEMAFTGDMYAYFEDFFDHLDPAPEYRVFMRLLDTPPYGGGTALANSFMLSRGPIRDDEIPGDGPRSTFVHELLHQWSGGLSGGAIETNWFSEGLTTYFEYTLPFRAGHQPFDDYVAGLNNLSRMYYTGPARDWPISEIKKVGFGDDEIRHVPYQRGAFYFADLDSRLKRASGGKSGLRHFLSRVLSEREAGTVDLTVTAWGDYVTEALGEDEAELLHTVHTTGIVFYPAPDAFGRCVTGERATLERDGVAFVGMKWRPAPGVDPKDCFAGN